MHGHDGHDAAADDREPLLQRVAHSPRGRGAHKNKEVDAWRHARPQNTGEHYQE